MSEDTSRRGRPEPAGSSPHSHQRSDSASYSVSPSRASVTARLATPIVGTPPPPGAQRVPKTENVTGTQTPLAGAGSGSVPGPGASSLSQALRGGHGSPPRRAAPADRENERFASPDRKGGGHGSFSAGSAGAAQLGQSPRPPEDLEVLKRHLAGPQNGSEPSSWRRGGSGQLETASAVDDDEFSSLQLQGGDTTRHIYRYAERREREQAEAEGPGRLRRSQSVSLPKHADDEESIHNVKVPGGFRRDHLRRQAGSPAPSSTNNRRPDYGTATRAHTAPQRQKPQFVTNNFIEFLTLYGHFAGEELEEDDEVLEPDEYFSSEYEADITDAEGEDREWGEDSALLTPGKRKRKRKPKHEGKGSPLGAAMLLLKSFVGTGVLFLPRAYLNGGMWFSNAVLLVIALLSYYCFILLVNTRLKVKASFGDMGGQTWGKYFRNLINFSLVISQIGFSSAYIVFVGENLQAFILAVSKCATTIPIIYVILMQMIIFLPLSLYRNINNIQKLALIADLFIVLGLIYIYFYDVKTIVQQQGVADIKAFNSKDWTLFIGTAIFTFEGIGLIIPIQSGMKDPRKFPSVLATVMVVISVIFISAGAVSYAAYGSRTKTVILLNMPQDDKLVNGVQFLYSLAILLSTPLQIYPAIEITSQQLFSRTGKYNPWIKWKKNIFRFFMVVLCAGIAWAGAGDLDKFVSLVGSFACIPLVFIYPPLMHYRAVADRPWQRITDLMLVVFGFVIMAYTTALTIINWVGGGQEEMPGQVDTVLNYYLEAADGGGEAVTYGGTASDKVKKRDAGHVKVTDVRGHEDEFNLDTNAFAFVKAATQLRTDMTREQHQEIGFRESTEIIEKVYRKSSYAEAIQIAKNAKDPKQVIPLNHPLMLVHVDQSDDGAVMALLEKVPEEEAARLQKTRWAIINVWCGLETVRRSPLAVLDARTIQDSEMRNIRLKMPQAPGGIAAIIQYVWHRALRVPDAIHDRNAWLGFVFGRIRELHEDIARHEVFSSMMNTGFTFDVVAFADRVELIE
ncbi:hypothetical protein EJ03DRAFT_355128 [Teratosphaeria nubilosa]|uniref:Amino acid transporter transmembrane domain-containing protein n=1 Tax=Teratosphaeria nubilosa TaxID=161662 RepID=A0A6G1KY45_9PEZI|nr:hypothetical protein EJ03DRAFT_355128 [Teratosphaeria nubilosa]